MTRSLKAAPFFVMSCVCLLTAAAPGFFWGENSEYRALSSVILHGVRGGDQMTYKDHTLTCGDLNVLTPDPNSVGSTNCTVTSTSCIFCNENPAKSGNTTTTVNNGGSSQSHWMTPCGGAFYQGVCIEDPNNAGKYICDLSNSEPNGFCTHNLPFTTNQPF